MRCAVTLATLVGWMPLLVPTLKADDAITKKPTLSITTDRPDALYNVGEPVSFTIKLTEDARPIEHADVQWKTSNDGMPPRKEGSVRLENGAAVVTEHLNTPGFLQCDVTWKSDAGDLKATAGAGISPWQITPSLPVPDDFDSFWANQKKLLSTIPALAHLTPVPSLQSGVDAFDVQVDCIGKSVSGYYARPHGAKPKSQPAIITFHGAGVDSSSLSVASGWAKNGFIAFDINAHGLANGKDKAFYKDLYDGELKSYFYIGRESRETTYFLGMFLRVLRALDFVTAQPEWDGQVLIVSGSSQGAAQAIAAAALDSRVTFLAAGVPAMCDHTGVVVDRTSGWPRFLAGGTKDNLNKSIMEMARYFDCMNMATRIKCPALFTVGFIDRTCAPTTVYAAYNNLPGEKTIFNDIPSAHVVSLQAGQKIREAILDHSKLKSRD